MKELVLSPAGLLSVAAFSAVVAVLLCALGGKIPRQREGVTLAGWFPIFFIATFGVWELLAGNVIDRPWTRGWILPRSEAEAAEIGTHFDLPGFWILLLASIATLLAIIHRPRAEEPAEASACERNLAAALFSLSGVCIASFALTPWMALIGIMLTALGGFFALSPRWELNEEAQLSVRFVTERFWGFMLSFVGACILASAKLDLSVGGASWGTAPEIPIGGALFAIGLVLNLQPFPLSGLTILSSRAPVLLGATCAYVLPAWAAIMVLARFESQLRAAGVMPILGYFALASAALGSLTGLFQRRWNLGLNVWLSQGFMLSVAAMAATKVSVGLTLAICVGLGGLALAAFGSVLGEEPALSDPQKTRTAWVKAGCFLAMAAGTGAPGFASVGAILRWLTGEATKPPILAATGLALFLSAALGWKTAWMATASAEQKSTRASWAFVLAPFTLILLSLGLFSTGLLTGGLVPGAADLVLQSPLSEFLRFAEDFEELGPSAQEFFAASGVHWVALVLAAVLAGWMAARGAERWTRLREGFPRMSGFFESGYRMDRVSDALVAGVTAVGRTVYDWVDVRAWEKWVPWALDRAIQATSQGVAVADRAISSRLESSSRRAIEVPAKFLQLIQSGNLQWYLFFAVGSGILMLLHFLKFH